MPDNLDGPAVIDVASAADLAALDGEAPAPAVLVLDDSSDARLVRSAIRAGARAILAREAAGAVEIAAAMAAARAGLLVMSPSIAASFLPELSSEENAGAQAMAEPLSGRELEVLDLMAAGLANKIIAYRLGISEHTVKAHVSSIFAKLGAGSRTEAVSQAVRRGLVML